MVQLFLAVLGAIHVFFSSRSDTALEILAQRQQVAVLKHQRPRPPLHAGDRLSWMTLRRFWSRWAEVLLIVKPETVGRLASRRFSTLLALAVASARRTAKDHARGQGFDRTLTKENPEWGAPKIHAELQKLGFSLAERTVARYLRHMVRRGDPGQRWLAFLENHREVIAALDFFTVPTVTFRMLYCFFVIEHQRRKILHCNVTPHPTAEWIQRLREAFPEPCRYRYVLSDRDRKFNAEVLSFLEAAGLETHQRACALAEWPCGAMDRKLPAGDSGPYHRAE